MADVGALHSLGSPSESSEYLSEHTPLLAPTFNVSSLTDKRPIVPASDLLSRVENGPRDAESYHEEDSKPQSAFAIIGLLLVGVFVSNADGTLVLATYATISSEFGAFENAAWLSTSYTLAMCAIQGIVGKLSDIYGRKGVLLVSYAGFAAGSVLM